MKSRDDEAEYVDGKAKPARRPLVRTCRFGRGIHGVVARLERFVSLAPLHQPHNLAPIRSILAGFPTLPQVACFDTAFHRTHSAVADHYAIPHQLHAEGVRRYGFHGLSYEYIAKTLPHIAPDVAKRRVIVAHLGSGASMCALKAGQSVESTMMGTPVSRGDQRKATMRRCWRAVGALL